MFEITFSGFIRILIVGSMTYIGFIIYLRITGKRALSQLNIFDFIVTVALGSTLSSILLDSSISLTEGLIGAGLLIFLQYIITSTSIRSESFKKLIKAKPTMLFFENQFLREEMKIERISEDEILQTVRQQGIGSLEDVKAVVLEPDGTLSVITSNVGNALSNVQNSSK